MLGNKFRVFRDLSIEIPIKFKDEEFDEFLIEVERRRIFDNPGTGPNDKNTNKEYTDQHNMHV